MLFILWLKSVTGTAEIHHQGGGCWVHKWLWLRPDSSVSFLACALNAELVCFSIEMLLISQAEPAESLTNDCGHGPHSFGTMWVTLSALIQEIAPVCTSATWKNAGVCGEQALLSTFRTSAMLHALLVGSATITAMPALTCRNTGSLSGRLMALSWSTGIFDLLSSTAWLVEHAILRRDPQTRPMWTLHESTLFMSRMRPCAVKCFGSVTNALLRSLSFSVAGPPWALFCHRMSAWVLADQCRWRYLQTVFSRAITPHLLLLFIDAEEFWWAAYLLATIQKVDSRLIQECGAEAVEPLTHAPHSRVALGFEAVELSSVTKESNQHDVIR